MDREQFIKEAPVYYALGISLALRQATFETYFDARDIAGWMATNDTPPRLSLLPESPLFKPAMRILAGRGLVDIVEDPFGPALYCRVSDVDDWIEGEGCDTYPLFRKYAKVRDVSWVQNALIAVNRSATDLWITHGAFENVTEPSQDQITEEDSAQFEIDRSTDEFKAMEAAVDEAIEKIESDNEFAINAPAERKVALDGLKNLQKTLSEEAQISWLYIKTFALTPLSEAAKKTGGGALSLAIEAAKAALKDWIKKGLGDAFKNIVGS